MTSRSGDADQEDPLAQQREALLEAAIDEADYSGWSVLALRRAAKAAGLDRETQRLIFPRGVIDALIAYSHLCDHEMEQMLQKSDLSGLKIRERITLAVRTRFEVMGRHKQAAVHAGQYLALPMHAATAASLVYRTVDRIWRAIGDMSTDFNFYSKRAILAGVLSSTFLFWRNDQSEEHIKTWEFLDRRIGDVMQIEKVKAKVRTATKDFPSPLSVLSRLRYGGLRRS